jgi:hypothetical protein
MNIDGQKNTSISKMPAHLKGRGTSVFKNYMEIQIRYLNYVCSVKRIDMLSAIELYSHRFKWLYLHKHIF